MQIKYEHKKNENSGKASALESFILEGNLYNRSINCTKVSAIPSLV